MPGSIVKASQNFTSVGNSLLPYLPKAAFILSIVLINLAFIAHVKKTPGIAKWFYLIGFIVLYGFYLIKTT